MQREGVRQADASLLNPKPSQPTRQATSNTLHRACCLRLQPINDSSESMRQAQALTRSKHPSKTAAPGKHRHTSCQNVRLSKGWHRSESRRRRLPGQQRRFQGTPPCLHGRSWSQPRPGPASCHSPQLSFLVPEGGGLLPLPKLHGADGCDASQHSKCEGTSRLSSSRVLGVPALAAAWLTLGGAGPAAAALAWPGSLLGQWCASPSACGSRSGV